MRISHAMMSSRVTPPIKEEGTDMDGVVKAGGTTVLDYLERNCASSRLTVAASMAYMTGKWSEMGKETKMA